MRILPAILRRFTAEAFRACGLPPEDAALAAEVLVDGNLDGIDSHGVSRLPVYVSCLRRGRIKPAPEIVMAQAAPALGTVDGGDGLGLVVGVKAMRFALSLADGAGLGLVAVRRSSHFGAASFFCKMAANAGKIGLVFTNTPSGTPPWGGKSAYLGTNPIAFGFPGKDGEHVLVDLSSSVVARGRILTAVKNGQSIPGDWAIDANGQPTTDPAEALKGAILPMAGPKGYALALAVEILAAILTGAAFGKHVGWMYDKNPEPVNIGHVFLAIDIAPLMDPALFLSRLAVMLDEIRQIPLADGHQAILIPGERKRATARQRSQGIPIPRTVADALDELARELDLPPLGSPAKS